MSDKSGRDGQKTGRNLLPKLFLQTAKTLHEVAPLLTTPLGNQKRISVVLNVGLHDTSAWRC
jgi:hypothetical protein